MIVHNSIDWSVIIKFSWKNVAYSLSVTLIAVILDFTFGDFLQIPIAIIATLGTALAIMLGFRNGSAYERWWEARKIWGGIVNDSRTFARQVLSMINADHGSGGITNVQKELIHAHLAHIHALRLQLRVISDEKAWDEDVFARIDSETMSGIRSKSNKAAQLLILQGKKLEQCRNSGQLSDYRHTQIDNTLTRFSDYQGKSERIKNTPFPKAYEIFNRILLNLFILFLPFSLLPILNGLNEWWLVIPVTVLTSWVFYGIHEMGILMAAPFENFRWDVPLDAICNTIEIDLLQAVNTKQVPEKLHPENGVLM